MFPITISKRDLKSIEILNLLADSPDLSQRALATQSGSSLGMVNLVLRRLVRTGYIKIVNLDRRKVHYLLTAKGLTEKANRSYHYLIRSIRVYHEFHRQLEEVINQQIAAGRTRFAIDGGGEIADLVKLILESKGSPVQFRSFHNAKTESRLGDEVILSCNLNNHSVDGVSVLETLLKSGNRALKGEDYELV